jgi:hypothetical protein
MPYFVLAPDSSKARPTPERSPTLRAVVFLIIGAVYRLAKAPTFGFSTFK